MTLYNRVKDDLLSKILDGTYPEGETIPSEIQLAEMYNVSRPTIRQAIQILASEGHVEKRRRRGTVVTRPKIDQSFTMQILSFEDEMRRMGKEPRTNVLVFKREKASEDVSLALQLQKGAAVYKLVRLRYADDIPNVFVESYIPCEAFPQLDDTDFEQVSLYRTMEELGNPVVHAHRHLEVSKAAGPIAALLDVEEGDPLIVFSTVARGEDERPVEYSIATYRGASNSFEFIVDRK